MPWNGDPSGAFLAPLALLALVFGNKRKRGKWDVFVIVLVLGLSLGLGVAACGGGTPTPAPAPGTNPAPETTPGVGGTEGAGTVTGDSGLVTVSPVTIVAYSCPTPDVANASTSTPPQTPTPTPYPSNAQMFLDAVLKHETELKQTSGFSVAILLAMGAVETGGGGQGYSAYSNEVYGGVLQVKGEFFGVSGTYDNTPQGYENNVKDAISTIKSFSKIDRENRVFTYLYTIHDAVKIDVGRNVLYYNAGYGWWQRENGYVTHPGEVGYTGRVASMLSNVVSRDFGYRDDDFVNPMLSVQNAVNCYLFDNYSEFKNITCNR